MAQLRCQSTHKPYLLILRLLIGHSATSWLGVHLSCLNIWLWVDFKKITSGCTRLFLELKTWFLIENVTMKVWTRPQRLCQANQLWGTSSYRRRCLWEWRQTQCSAAESPKSPSCPGSRPSCVRTLPPRSDGWAPLARSTSCRRNRCPCRLSDWTFRAGPAFRGKNKTKKKNGQTMSIITFISRSPR